MSYHLDTVRRKYIRYGRFWTYKTTGTVEPQKKKRRMAVAVNGGERERKKERKKEREQTVS